MRATPLALDPIMTAMRQAGLGVEHGYLDPSPYNEAGAGHFVYHGAGAPQRALVMVSRGGSGQWQCRAGEN